MKESPPALSIEIPEAYLERLSENLKQRLKKEIQDNPEDYFPGASSFSFSKLMTTDEVAEKLGVSTVTVRNLIHEGKMASVKIGKNIKISEEHLNNFLQTNQTPAK